jgi:hydrogenase nickel incorporation protein HypB
VQRARVADQLGPSHPWPPRSPPARRATSTRGWSMTRSTTCPWRSFDLFAIENVGNLVCPAIYDLGQAANVVALSVTEGEDKPIKYPVMFRNAELVLLTKIDLLPHLDVDIAAIRDGLARVMPEPKLIAVSGKTGEGIGEWLAWLEARRP